MLFRYDFGQKLDLTNFRKQATHYISTMSEVTYHLIFPDFRIEIEIITSEAKTSHLATIQFSEITRDSDGEITKATAILPHSDLRFKEIKDITSTFPLDHYRATINSNNVSKTVDTICMLAKVVHKINNLKAFL